MCALPHEIAEVPLQQTLEGLAVTGLVAGHFMNGIMDGIEPQLLGLFGQLELAGGSAVLGVHPHLQVLLGAVGQHLAQQLGELGGVLGLLIGGLLPVQADLGITLAVGHTGQMCIKNTTSFKQSQYYLLTSFVQVWYIFLSEKYGVYHFSTSFGGTKMAKAKDTGVFKMDNGVWAYRFTIIIDGQQVSRRKSTDAFGNKLLTKRDAIKARVAAIEQAHLEREQKKKIVRKTVKEVYKEYCTTGRSDRAYRTIQKQDSLWNNHLCDRFGKSFIDDISVAEITDYLSELYYQRNFSYTYVESFLKMFYLIFGQAYSRNYLDVDSYNKLCVNKSTKIHMPKMKTDDDTDIVAFSREELETLDQYFKGTNAETAYMLGRFCGLRINECFGLKWDHVIEVSLVGQVKRNGGSENQSRRFTGAWKCVCCTTAFFLLPSCGSFLIYFTYCSNSFVSASTSFSMLPLLSRITLRLMPLLALLSQ